MTSERVRTQVFPDTYRDSVDLMRIAAEVEGFDLERMGHNSAEYVHTVTEALKLALADRDEFYGDPDFARVPAAFLALSSPGRDSQDRQALQVLLDVAVFDMRPQKAVEAPRFNSRHHHESFGGHAYYPGLLQVESRIPPSVVDALRRLGHAVELLGPFVMDTATTLAGVDPRHGTLFGAADVRRQRFVTGW